MSARIVLGSLIVPVVFVWLAHAWPQGREQITQEPALTRPCGDPR